jgi:hypothetical protein
MQQRVIDQAVPGWKVWGADDRELGEVTELGDGYLQMSTGRIFGKRIYVPEAFVDRVDAADERVRVKVGKDQLESMGWNRPPGGGADDDDDALGIGGDQGAGSDAWRIPH